MIQRKFRKTRPAPKNNSKTRSALKLTERKIGHLVDECVIPGRVADSVLDVFALDRPEHDANAIRQYVEVQARPEKVTHLEKVKTEQLFERRYEVWDVRTNKDRYWVITGPTNLYSQKHFPGADYTLSFHIGVTTRVMARQRARDRDEREDRLAPAWRRLIQAAEALETADEAEDFQAVGMRCREALLAMTRGIANEAMVPAGKEHPQKGNFLQWAELNLDPRPRRSKGWLLSGRSLGGAARTEREKRRIVNSSEKFAETGLLGGGS